MVFLEGKQTNMKKEKSMNRIILGLLISIGCVGCTTVPFMNENPEPQEVLVEAGTLALGIYTTTEDKYLDSQVRGLYAIEKADEYLVLMYGYGPLGREPKYTLSGLLHSELLNRILDPKLRRLAIVGRIVLSKDGELTGITWVDALVLAEQVVPGVDVPRW